MKLKVNTVTSDGAAVQSPRTVTINHPRTGEPLVNGDGTPAVTITVQPRTPAEWRAIRKAHQTPWRNPSTRMIEMVSDGDAAMDDLLAQSVQAWAGIIGSDDQPLRVCPATVAALDPAVKMQVFNAILEAEVVETAEASFRQPA